jgi:hypothetical protein
MRIKLKQVKKILSVGATASLTCIISSSPALADTPVAMDSGSAYLQQIAQYTHDALDKLNALPNDIFTALNPVLSSMTSDQLKSFGEKQTNFVNYNSLIQTNYGLTLDKQRQILEDLFAGTPPTNANDLTFQTLLGVPYFPITDDPKNPASATQAAYNYMKNAAGLAVHHTVPSPSSWSGAQADQDNYTNYYNTITAIESFNAYIMSQFYQDSLNKNAVTTAQQGLMTQASNSQWYLEIASEGIAPLLRQLLMYNAQVFVLQMQSLNVQKQILAAQTMTNTMLAITGSTNEQLMLRKAIQAAPGS